MSADQRDLLKLSPLFDWTREAVRSFAAANHVPANSLHARRYLSIDCAPCTRAVALGGSEHDGRRWWENDKKRNAGSIRRTERVGLTYNLQMRSLGGSGGCCL